MRTLRFSHAARTTALGTAALVAALSLTACQDGGQAAAGSAAAASDTPSPQSPAATGTPADQGDEKPGSGSTAGSGSDADSGSVSRPADAEHAADKRQGGEKGDGPVTRACDGGNSKVTLTPVPRPVNHLLLTGTNTGSEACNAYHHPFLRFGEAQSTPPVQEDSKPQAVVTLSPGQSAYAGVTTSSADGSGTGGYSTKRLTVSFQGREGGGSSGPSKNVPLGKAVYVDSTLSVTYWQTDMNDALMY
ncbi:DUF4232 domain-containing protein [Streptomyces sp. NPDC006289]|uniref:DUF4232 domain-containing protein n=1 Tax=Streptomyces sp. NPDC006289 TaxID=3156744 RepID=UPI0033A27DA7